MATRKFSAFTAGGTNQVPTDVLVGLDLSLAANAQNTKWTLNDLFAVVTRNITDGALRFGGFAAPALSGAGEGAIYFDSTSNTFKISQNAGAYANIGNVSTTGFTTTRIPIASGANTLTDDAGLTFNTTTNILTVGETTGGGVGLLGSNGNSNVLASQAPAATLLTYWPNAAPTAGQFLYAATVGAQVQLGYQTAPSGSGSANQIAVWGASNALSGSSALTFASGVVSITGTTNPGVVITGSAATESGITVNQSVSGAAADAFHSFQTPSSTVVWRLTTAGFTPTGLIKANQLDMFAASGTVEMLFRLADASTRFVYGVNNVEAASINATSTLGLVLGVASTLTGRVRMFNSAGATYTQLSAGNAAASLNYILPATSPTLNQVLTASAPSGSDVTLSWSTPSGGSSLTATQVGFGDGSNLLSGSADFTYTTATGVLDVTKTGVNSSVRMTVTNASAGTAAQARHSASANVSGIAIAATSSTFTTAGLITSNTAYLDMDAPNAVIAAQAAGTLIFGMGTTTERARLSDTTFLLSVDPTTGSGLNVASATVTTGNLARIAMTGTAAASNTKTALNVTSSGANGTASQTVFGSTISVTNTGTTNTNVALQLTASGGSTANTALNVVAGQVVLPAGTVGAPSLAFAGSLTTGIFSVSASNVSVAAAGVEYLRVTAQKVFIFSATLEFQTDLILRRAAAASLAFGAVDAAAPVAQTLSVQSVVAGTSDTAGANWTFTGSRGTGTGQGGSLIWQVAPAGSTGSTQNALINGLVLTGDGRLYGSALHNNTGAVTGTTNQYVASGTYTPTVTAVANCTATSSGPCNWIRVGNVVTVSGIVAIDPTVAATLTSVGISLPIASNLATNASTCAGVAANSNSLGYSGAITADLTNDRAQLDATVDTDVSNQAWSFSFTYVVL